MIAYCNGCKAELEVQGNPTGSIWVNPCKCGMTTQEYDHRFRMVRLVAEDDYLLFENSGTNDKGKWLLRARGDIPRILEFFGVIIVPGPGDFLYKLLRCEIIEKIGEVL